VICNCPAILVTTPILATEVGPATPDDAPAVITLKDNGRTFILQPGQRFLLDLGGGLDWTVEIDHPQVLAAENNASVVAGMQGFFQAKMPGQALLTAVGDPLCRKSTPACEAPSLLFKILVVVR